MLRSILSFGVRMKYLQVVMGLLKMICPIFGLTKRPFGEISV